MSIKEIYTKHRGLTILGIIAIIALVSYLVWPNGNKTEQSAKPAPAEKMTLASAGYVDTEIKRAVEPLQRQLDSLKTALAVHQTAAPTVADPEEQLPTTEEASVASAEPADKDTATAPTPKPKRKRDTIF